jgi:hypothetical protein
VVAVSNVPDCPECDCDVYVDQSDTGSRDFRCWLCNIYWRQDRFGGEWGRVRALADAPETGRM